MKFKLKFALHLIRDLWKFSDYDERTLYLFLVLAGDRHGISFYHYDSICTLLRTSRETYIEARNALIHKDLIAFDGTRFQVLSLPDKPIQQAPSALDDPPGF